jgi:hypothetical protein
MRKWLIALVAIVSFTSCTPDQRAAWFHWYSLDPEAAKEFAIAWTVWDDLAHCESNGNWSINTGNGYYGGLQFTLSSWQAVGGTGYPHEHTRDEQIHRGELLLRIQGWGAWPGCAERLALHDFW